MERGEWSGLRRRAECSHEALAVADPVVVVLELAAVVEVLVSVGLAAAAARRCDLVRGGKGEGAALGPPGGAISYLT